MTAALGDEAGWLVSGAPRNWRRSAGEMIGFAAERLMELEVVAATGADTTSWDTTPASVVTDGGCRAAMSAIRNVAA